MKYTTNSPEQTKKVGYELAKKLADEGRRYVALRGEMGVGKTAFTAGFCSFFEVSTVKSPTYTVMNEYRGKDAVVYHFDMYRITDGDDLYSIGYDDYLDSGAYILVEWSENIEDFIPDDAVTVTIERCDSSDSDRLITVEL